MNSTQMINGNKTERSTVAILRENGYWCYNTPLKTGGQPVDIVAAKKTTIILIDAKNVSDDVSFPFSRIEPNQVTSMFYAKHFANLANLGFAIYFERINETYWLDFDEYGKMKYNGIKSVNVENLAPFEDFLKSLETKNENDYLE